MVNKKWLFTKEHTLEYQEKRALLNLFPELDTHIEKHYKNIEGMMIIQQDEIVFEQYYHGATKQDTFNMASVTKSIISAIVGITIDKGYIKSVDEKVLDFFPEYVPKHPGSLKSEITIQDLLMMRAPYPFANFKEPLDRIRRQKDWVKYGLDLLGEKGKPDTFLYSSIGVHLLSAIITQATGKNARAFANTYLFEPIGIKTIAESKMQSFSIDEVFGKKIEGWATDREGNSTGGWGLRLSLEAMARFGYLYLNQGRWEAKQIVSKAWIDQSIYVKARRLDIASEADIQKYGYLWWIHEKDNVFAYLAMGTGGNIICCIPEKAVVIAIASTLTANPRDRWALIEEQILPFIKE